MLPPLDHLPGIGPKTQTRLKKLKITSVQDLLHHYPRTYHDFSKLKNISDLKEGLGCTVKVKILSFTNQYLKKRFSVQRVLVQDQTGQIKVTWFNQPFLEHNLKPGITIYLSATPQLFRGQIQFNSPDYEIADPKKDPLHTNRLLPLYPSTAGLNSKFFRKVVHQALHFLPQKSDFIPPLLLKKHSLLDLPHALKQIHQPQDQKSLREARKRLGLNEVLLSQLSSHLKKQSWENLKPDPPLSLSSKKKKIINDFIESLPFGLTPSQKKTWQELKTDLLSLKKITNRLLQGDVGSGKTLIALLGALLTSLNARFSLILVPTNILACQHHQSFKKLLKKTKIPVYLLTAKEKKFLKEKNPPPGIIIATQAALFDPQINQKNIAFLVIDEQHRFGVKQRAFLLENKTPPHTLTMTATPIPRTMHLAFLNWLDVSTLDPIPQNKRNLTSRLVPEEKRPIFYHWLDQNILKKGQQILFICPLIDLQENEEKTSTRSAKQEYENLKNVFPKKKIALLHGQTKKKDQEKILEKMALSQLDILVATSVIEVGIDLPNTSAIVIENAELFGLAQLHQLRGRVGRRGQPSFCFLFSDKRNQRLLYFLKNEDGLKLSQKDLLLRGPGLLFDTAQHGFPQFKIAHPYDLSLIKLAQLIIGELESLGQLKKLHRALLSSSNSQNQLAPN
jgi:ATP-dependent DNA helicase RecG